MSDPLPEPPALASPPAISGYRLIRVIEVDSTGEVWLAEQEQPVLRRVALKLVNRSTNAGEAIARFKSDRQLASLDHPAILKVLEAGSTARQLYFAMEYAEGEPIMVYCREQHLELRDRLELFLAVCKAVQYAHQKAVIHRDLRPSNILIAAVDGRRRPGIMGFGIARALAECAESTAYTSPEAAASSGANIDTRADVYSLGVILRELLKGDSPAETSPDTPARRQGSPSPAAEALRIARKASEADRSNRYDSIQILIQDIRGLIKDISRYRQQPAHKGRAAWFAPLAAAAVILVLGTAFAIWKVRRAPAGAANSGLAVASITVGPEEIKSGRDLQIRIDGVPADWTGEVTVNSLHRFALDSRVFRLRVNAKNGFEPGKVANLYILLTDFKGRQIPLSNGGRFRVSVIPALVSLDREERSGSAEGWSSSFEITADSNCEWSVNGVPEWIKIDSRQSGKGPGVVSYTVLENQTNEERSAVLAIGDARFTVTQERPPIVQIPFRDKFQFSSPPPELWTLLPRGEKTPVESPERWVWEQLGGQGASLSLAHESPSEGNSLLITRLAADNRVLGTLLYLPHVNFRFGTDYLLTVWMKAEKAAEVAISVGQSTAPWWNCSAKQDVQVSHGWTKYDVPIKVTAPNCEPVNNRLVFATGRVDGKLWIADLSLGAGR